MDKNIKYKNNEIHKTRRKFLKKATYAAPTILILGSLIKPKKANAGFGGPPSDPEGDDGSW
jgi:hypothetical protein